MVKLGDIEVQYITCYLTSQQKALSADRLKDMDPKMSIFSDTQNQNILFVIRGLNIDPMRSTRVKEGLDLYIIKPETKKLEKLLVQIIGPISKQVHIDRSLRNSKDPRPTYINSGGLSIPIEQLSVPVKVNQIIANYASTNYKAEINRSSIKADEPTIKIDVENKANWDRPRMHIGIHENWKVQKQLFSDKDEIIIEIPWEEIGHLLGSIVSAERGLSS